MTFIDELPGIPVLVLVVVLLAALGYLVYKINVNALEKYQYEIFSTGQLIFMMMPWLLFFGALYILGNESGHFAQTIQDRDVNVITLIIVCAVLVLGRFIYVWKKTSLLISLFSTTILLIAAPIVLVICLIIFVVTAVVVGSVLEEEKRKKGKNILR